MDFKYLKITNSEVSNEWKQFKNKNIGFNYVFKG